MLENDHWTLDIDRLGMGATGDRLARLILQCRPPYAICVQGKWGSGKTSLMRYAMASLGGEPLAMTLKTASQSRRELPKALEEVWEERADRADDLVHAVLHEGLTAAQKTKAAKRTQVVSIWFNPWQHQTAEMPLVALLQEVRAQFSDLLKAARWAGKLSQVGIEAGLTLLGELVDAVSVLHGGPRWGAGNVFSGLRERGEAYEKRHFEGLENAQRLNLLFEQAVERLLRPREGDGAATDDGRQLRRLVIFIDDLDRCSDVQTVKLLEAIKLYLQTRYCVFVIGMDAGAARRAVQRVLPHTGPEEAQEYLEKLFQNRVPVQVPGRHEPFVEELLERAHLRKGATGEEPAVLARRIGALVEPNPRKLKNFVNALAVGWQIHSADGRPLQSFKHYLALSYLRSYHPEVFRLLAYAPELAGDLHGVLTEGAALLPAGASAVELFFHRSFRHAFPRAFDREEPPTRRESDEVVDELLARLDRHSGDRAFIRLWGELFDDSSREEVAAALGPALQVACSRPAEGGESGTVGEGTTERAAE